MIDLKFPGLTADRAIVPGRDNYEGMSLGRAVRWLAERNYEHATGHISADEYQLLLRAAHVLERDHSTVTAFT